jgi:hypothetical protein
MNAYSTPHGAEAHRVSGFRWSSRENRPWRSLRWLACAGLALAAPNWATAATAPLAFEGVELGATVAAWRSLKPPGPIPIHARQVCSSDPGASGQLNLAGAPPGAVVCGYVDTYGATRVAVSFPWRKYRMDHLRYVFEGGRLTQVRALIDNDAFEALAADFDRDYGPAKRIVRDTVASEIGRRPRVTETWATPHGVVEVVDPVPPFLKLSVRMMTQAAQTQTAQR